MHKLLVTAALKQVRQLESISEIQSVMISLTRTFAGRKRQFLFVYSGLFEFPITV